MNRGGRKGLGHARAHARVDHDLPPTDQLIPADGGELGQDSGRDIRPVEGTRPLVGGNALMEKVGMVRE